MLKGLGIGNKMDYPAALDPYEQQLLKVFDSYDFESRGSLDREGLMQLCCTLQLEEQGTALVQHLLRNPKNPRVTFTEFKEALLTLLGNVQNTSRSQSDDSIKESEKGSPDREVSPKFVYGSKKYGRRSRPRNDDSTTPLDDNDENLNYSNKISYNTAVQRSNSQCDAMHSKKRKTNTKLKRCTSFPGSHEVVLSNNLSNDQEFVCTEAMLRKAWEKLGVGEDGYLNQTELILVCDAIGLHRLANGVIRQLSKRLELDVDHRISFQELLVALQQDDTWSDVLETPPESNRSLLLNMKCLTDTSLFPDHKTVQHITLGPDGTGFVNVDLISEMWEGVGISSPKILLQELGFLSSQINVSELAVCLEKEIKGMNEARSAMSNPHVVLLQAILTLYRSEIRCLKNIVEQMHAEREKLKGDVLDANNRATMLAQEVDDNHARMEQNTQSQVKLLEQRHCDVVKEMSEQHSSEKELLTHHNNALEEKILCLETEEARLRNDLLVAQKYSSSIEKENQALTGQVSELQQLKEVLTEQVTILETEKQQYEYEREQVQVEPLLAQLSSLQIENSQLRDKNDEMVTEIESLNNKILAMRTRTSSPRHHEHSMEDVITCESITFGFKRRNDESPSKDLEALGIGGTSPRLGKLRRCNRHKTNDSNEMTFNSSESSGFDTELDVLDSSLSVSANETKEVGRLQAKIALLEQILAQHSIPIPAANAFSETESYTNDTNSKLLTKRCRALETLLQTLETEIGKVVTEITEPCGCQTYILIKNLHEKLKAPQAANIKSTADACTEIDNLDEEMVAKYVKENEDLVKKCSELENCVELLKCEYERCEDYWSSKLDEERQMFEQEQSQSGEKLSELIAKMAEYESQFAQADETDYRLPPIEEKYNLEKQFTDLEQEFDDFKEHAEFQIAEKNNEIADLKEMLDEASNKSRTAEIGIQTVDPGSDLTSKMRNLSNCMVESTNLFSADTMPFNWSVSGGNNLQSNSLDTQIAEEDVPMQRDYVNPQFVWQNNKSEKVANIDTTTNMNIPWRSQSISAESTSSTVTDNNSSPSKPKRSRRHEKSYQKPTKQGRRDSEEKTGAVGNPAMRWRGIENLRTANSEPTVQLPISSVHNLNGRLHHLEQRCRHLQMVLKQQHYHAEQMLNHYWTQHRGEKAELQYMLKTNQEKLEQQMRVCNEQLERLAKTDMLVKDLYVENSYLVANVQRLEKQCHLLTQYNSTSSSV